LVCKLAFNSPKFSLEIPVDSEKHEEMIEFMEKVAKTVDSEELTGGALPSVSCLQECHWNPMYFMVHHILH